MAHIDVEKAEVIEIYPLGFKDWSVSGLDASDRDGMINIQNWPIRGLYQPDAMRLIQHGNRTLLVTANEGDAKKYKVKDDGITWTDKARGKIFAEGEKSQHLNSHLFIIYCKFEHQLTDKVISIAVIMIEYTCY